MEKFAVAILVFVIITPAVFGVAVEPFLSLPGNKTVVTFLDLHLSYNDNGSCGDPDWRMWELAYSLEWKILSEENIGLEVYDTCRSNDRTLSILRHRFLQDRCDDTETSDILGVISYSSEEISDLIKDTLHLKVIPYINARNQAKVAAQNRLIQALILTLNEAKWTYVTTMADNNELSQAEKTIFLSKAKENNICVQYSFTMSENTSEFLQDKVKTPGIIVFTSSFRSIQQTLNNLPPKHHVIIVTHDISQMSLNLTNKILLLRDSFPQNNASKYFLDQLSNNGNLSENYRHYFVSRHNCSWNDSSNDLSCATPSSIMDYFSARSSKFDINFVLHAMNMLIKHSENSSSTNGIDDNSMVAMTSLQNGKVLQSITITLNDSTNPSQVVSQLLNTGNHTFPSSQCDDWCPSCTACSGHVAYDGDFRYIPGDILLTGLFPMRQKGRDIFSCGAVDFNGFSDIYAAAFEYAIDSAQTRSPGLLPNVTVGGLIFDVCSDADLASRTLLNFESCMYSFKLAGNDWAPSPQIVPGYIVPTYANSVDMDSFANMEKLGIGVHGDGALLINNEKIYEPSRFNYSAVVHMLKAMDWTYVGIITSEDFDKQTVEGFFENTLSKNICIAYRTEISTAKQSSILNAISLVRQYPAAVVIFFARSNAIQDFFRAMTYKPLNKLWILVETRDDHLDDINAPLGSIIFQRNSKQNTDFNQHYASNAINTPWEAIFKQARGACVTPGCTREVATPDTWMRASDIIKSVDIAFHAVHEAYTELCPKLLGLCRQFMESGSRLTLDKISHLGFEYQGEPVQPNNTDVVLDSYAIANVHLDGLVKVGTWSTNGLDLDKSLVKFYTVDGVLIQRNVDSYCASKCNCVNNLTAHNTTAHFGAVDLDPEMGFVDSSAEFDRSLWSIIVLIISMSGCVITLAMMMYIMCKVCAGALIRRYLVLGLLLLVAILFLFLSVLPFVFTPSEVGCGMRFFAHGFAYAFSYAIMLTKMTALRDYKYIGLGGDVSRLNQLLSVFFITGVQIAIGVQWLVLGRPTLIQTIVPEKSDGEIQNVTYYACDLERRDFIAYHSYVMLLLVICCFYSISVRKETKNMKEARLLLVCSWFCLALWIAIVITFLILKRDYLEPIAAIGLLANALSMMVIIYLPKLTVIARLKYEISDKGGKQMENGYKVDTDFQFERPYSLPGTMHTTFTEKNGTLSRSLAAFDSSLSY